MKMRVNHLLKRSLCILLGVGMTLNGGTAVDMTAFAAANTKVHEIVVDGDMVDPFNTFKGFGAVTCNNTSRLLMDYKEEHPDKYWEMMELLFNPEKGAGLNHIKVEMGGDVNSSSGTEPATMRSPEEEANVLRGAGWHFAADAKTINPEITVEILRWGEPKWTQEGIGYETFDNPKFEARYQWYKKTIDAVYAEYGYEINYVSPSQNERRRDYGDNTAWIKYCAQRLNEDAGHADAKYDYSEIQIVAADTHSNSADIAGRMLSDKELMDLVDVVSDHYTLYGNDKLTQVNEEYGKEIWYSEAIAPMINAKYRVNVDPSRGGVGGKVGMADLATRFINSYSYEGAGDNPARMTRFEFQPAIGAFYEGSAYSPKQLIGAFDPWSGYYEADGGLQMVGHFMEFAKLGWNYLPDACFGDGSYSDGGVLADTGTNNYMTLKDPETDDYTMIFANNTSQVRTYQVTVKNLKKASSSLNVWETRGPDVGEAYDANWMQMVDSFTPNKQSYGVYTFHLTVKPYSIATVTSLSDHGKEYEPGQNDSQVDRTVLELPYKDDFEYQDYELDERGRTYLERRGGTPRYMTDQYGAFEVKKEGDGSHALTQVMNNDNRPYDWNVWGNGTDENSQTSGRPRTVFGDHRWANYVAGIDFKLDLTSPECFENYAGIGVREVVHEGTSANDIATYTFQVFKDGSYKLSSRSGAAETGKLENFDASIWHTMELSADEHVLTAYVDGEEAAKLIDEKKTSMSGRVTLTSGFYHTKFDNLSVLPIEGKAAAADQKLDDTSDLITWNGNWSHVLNEGYAHFNRTRTYGGAVEKGVYAHNCGQVRYYKGGNPLAWGSNDANSWGSAADNAHYEFDFYGTGIEIFGEANGSNGVGDVYIDGELTGTVNYNNTTGGTGHDTFSLGLDPNELHTVKVVAKSSFISLQKLKVIGELDQGGESNENSLSLAFHGTGLNVFGNSGSATIRVDVDGVVKEEAFVTAQTGNRQTSYSLQNLEEGEHTVKITVVGGTYYIDGIDVIGTAADAPDVDRSKLQILIEAVKKLTNEDGSYLEESWKLFQAALALAEEVVNSGNQAAVNKAYLELRNAMEKLGNAGAISAVTGLEALYVTSVQTLPKLPQEVEIIRADGKASTASVEWQVSETMFDAPFETVTVTGTAGPDAYPIKTKVEVIPEGLQYFIDCTSDVPVNPNGGGALNISSGVYKAIKAYAEENGNSLLNDKADQKYTDSNDVWGFELTKASTPFKPSPDGAAGEKWDKYEAGWRTTGTEIVYRMKLRAGTYGITTGFHDWYGNRSRDMTPVLSYIDQEGNKKEITFDIIASRGTDMAVTNKFSLPVDSEVTYKLIYAANEKPILSWLAVAETGLLEKIEITHMPEKTAYSLGDKLDTAGMVVTATYDNERIKKLTSDEYTVSAFDSSVPGEKILTVTAREADVTVTFSVTVGGDLVENLPKLPAIAAEETLPVEMTASVNGEEKTVPVSWEMLSGDWNVTGSVVHLKGTLEGVDAGSIQWNPTVYSTSQVYLIDCGMTEEEVNESAVHEAVKAAVPSLVNQAADQGGEGNLWGYGSDVDSRKGFAAGHGLHSSGWFGKNTKGDSFTYRVTLDAGEYNVTTGHTEWWSGNNRTTQVKASYADENGKPVEIVLGSTGWSTGIQWTEGYVQGHLSIPEDGTEVTLTFTAMVAKGAAVSYISIEEGEEYTPQLTINKIKVDSAPNKMVYEMGESFETTGMVVNGYYGSELVRELEAEEYTIDGPDTSEAGLSKVTVTYENENGKKYSSYFKVRVYDPEDLRADSIKVVKEPEKMVYGSGENFDASGMEVRLLLKATASDAIPAKAVELNDGEYDVVSNFSESGKAKVIVCYTYLDENGEEQELKDEIKVTVIDEEQEYYQKGITVTKQPKKTVYEIGSSFEPAGMEVEAVMKASASNASYAEKITDYEIEEYDFSEVGKHDVEITYEGMGNDGDIKVFTAKVPVTVTDNRSLVKENELDGVIQEAQKIFDEGVAEYRTLEEKKQAVQTVREGAIAILADEEVDFTKNMSGQVEEIERYLQVVYPNVISRMTGAEELVMGGTIVGALLSADLSNENQVIEINVWPTAVPEHLPEVKAASAMDIKMKIDGEETAPVVPLLVTMKIPKGLDHKELAIYHFKEAGEIEVIVPEVIEDEMQFVIRSFSTFVAVNTGKLAVTGIEITKNPYKMVYQTGEEFEADGMVITASYENGTKAVVTDYGIEGFDSLTAGKKQVIITYEGKKAALEITIEKKKGTFGGGGSSVSHTIKVPVSVPGCWKKDEKGWWYEKTAGGYLKSEWGRVNGLWYYFNGEGYMATGWLFDGSKWYFLNQDGAMVENSWILNNDRWYFLGSGGAMAANTTTPDGWKLGVDGAWIQE